MDETFIRMCKEATEIQDQWKPMGGDRVIVTQFGQIELEYLSKGIEDKKGSLMYHKGGSIWLPRQEDLQKIYLNHLRKQLKHPKIIQLDGFLLFPMADWYNSPKHAKLTITQAWLCFVMETIYNKQWNGSTWEVIE